MVAALSLSEAEPVEGGGHSRLMRQRGPERRFRLFDLAQGQQFMGGADRVPSIVRLGPAGESKPRQCRLVVGPPSIEMSKPVERGGKVGIDRQRLGVGGLGFAEAPVFRQRAGEVGEEPFVFGRGARGGLELLGRVRIIAPPQGDLTEGVQNRRRIGGSLTNRLQSPFGLFEPSERQQLDRGAMVKPDVFASRRSRGVETRERALAVAAPTRDEPESVERRGELRVERQHLLESLGGLVDAAELHQRAGEAAAKPRIMRLALDGGAKSLDRAGEVAATLERLGEPAQRRREVRRVVQRGGKMGRSLLMAAEVKQGVAQADPQPHIVRFDGAGGAEKGKRAREIAARTQAISKIGERGADTRLPSERRPESRLPVIPPPERQQFEPKAMAQTDVVAARRDRNAELLDLRFRRVGGGRRIPIAAEASHRRVGRRGMILDGVHRARPHMELDANARRTSGLGRLGDSTTHGHGR